MNLQARTSLRTDLSFALLGVMLGLFVLVLSQGLALLAAPLITAVTAPALPTGATSGWTAFIQQQAAAMDLPLSGETSAYWYVARSGGILAYLLLWAATFWGVAMSSKLFKGMLPAPLVYGLHEYLPRLALIFAGLHALVLLGDSYVTFNLVTLLVPFTASYEPLWTGLGTLAFYLSAALVLSFTLRDRTGRKPWRLFHYSAYLAFGLAMVHGITAGTDSSVPAVRWMYLLTGATLLFATFFRIFTARFLNNGPSHGRAAGGRGDGQ